MTSKYEKIFGVAEEAPEQDTQPATEELKTLVEQWRYLLDEASVHEKEAKQLKAEALEIAASIQASFNMQGVASMKFKDLGVVYNQTDRKVRLADINKLCEQQITQFAKAMEEGRTFSDALLFQQRPLQNELIKLIDNTTESEDWGVLVINETSLKFRKN